MLISREDQIEKQPSRSPEVGAYLTWQKNSKDYSTLSSLKKRAEYEMYSPQLARETLQLWSIIPLLTYVPVFFGL